MKQVTRWFGFAAVLVVPFIQGCGSGSNNDQGVSFTLLGYSSAEDGACSTVPNLAGGVVPIGSVAEEPGASGRIVAGMVVRNNLVRTPPTDGAPITNPSLNFVRTEFATFEYFIPGAQIQPPATTMPFGLVVEPNGGLGCGQIPIVPAEVTAWISFNRGSLPETPFLLQVVGSVTGVTSSGNVIETNPVNIGFTVTTDNVIPPSQGSDDEVVDGGDGVDGVTGEGLDEAIEDIIDDETDDSGAL